MSENSIKANRRNFIAGMAVTSAAAVSACTSATANSALPIGAQKAGSVMDLVVPKMDTVRIAMIGVGQRGGSLLGGLVHIEGCEITAICDTNPRVIDLAKKKIEASGRPQPVYFTDGPNAYLKMLERDDIDIVIIATPWSLHTPMSVAAMQAGKHAFTEVPCSVSVDECWELVETSEKTRLNCMMMENVCYGRDEMMVLKMIREGLLGDLTHGEAAYIHELRWQMKEVTEKTGSWRTGWHARRNGNLYPTHGLGPVAQYMDINRGDRFDYMTSMSSPAIGRQAYAAREFPSGHQRNQLKYIAGDMNSTLIKTVKGRSILVQHDTTTPRPYTRLNMIQGTNGAFAGFPNRIALENNPVNPEASFHKWDEDMKPWYERYDHPLWKKMLREAKERGGHGGMDFVMLWRIIYCLRNGLPLDQNVYDAAAWSVITPLSEASVKNRSASVNIPDFTRGAWKDTAPLDIKL